MFLVDMYKKQFERTKLKSPLFSSQMFNHYLDVNSSLFYENLIFLSKIRKRAALYFCFSA